MDEKKVWKRRAFLASLGAGVAGAAVAPQLAPMAKAATAKSGRLRVWSCGGLSEPMCLAHEAFSAQTGIDVAYTGARASALGKSLLNGGGSTDVFAGRGLGLAKQLRKEGALFGFVPLCFTHYGIAVRKGNPTGIKQLEDLVQAGVRVSMAPLASPPGGQAIQGLLKNAALLDKIMPNVLDPRATCVQRSITEVIESKSDAMIVECRICRTPRYAEHLEFIPIPPQFFPKNPLTFTVGIMTNAKDLPEAKTYLNWITSLEGQAYFERGGFIPAQSVRGQELVEELEVKDV